MSTFKSILVNFFHTSIRSFSIRSLLLTKYSAMFLLSPLLHSCTLINHHPPLHLFMHSLCTFPLGWRTLCIVIIFRVMWSIWTTCAYVHLRMGTYNSAYINASHRVLGDDHWLQEKFKALGIQNDGLVFHLFVKGIVQIHNSKLLLSIIVRVFHSLSIWQHYSFPPYQSKHPSSRYRILSLYTCFTFAQSQPVLNYPWREGG